jgi:excisionase family DNA binding protein
MTTEKLLTFKEAVKLLGVSRATIYNMVARGELIAFRQKVGRAGMHFRREDLEKLIGWEKVER